jgi:serine O-acetyltransferase
MKKNYNIQFGFLYLLTFVQEYRNLFYYRIGHTSIFLKFLCIPMNTLFINTKEIGPGLFIQHGFSTIISAKKIGKDCWINQQVTIGYSNATDCPTLGDNVSVNAGAKIIGNVFIGNNSKIGANAVVVKNVPENCTVVGVPAYIVRRNGIKQREEL